MYLMFTSLLNFKCIPIVDTSKTLVNIFITFVTEPRQKNMPANNANKLDNKVKMVMESGLMDVTTDNVKAIFPG